MTIEITPLDARPGQMVTAAVKYTGGGDSPTDVHIDVWNGSDWDAVTGYTTIPPGLDPEDGFDIRFSLGNATIGGPGPHRFRVRWTRGGTDIVENPYSVVTFPPAPPVFEDSITKNDVMDVMKWTVIFILTPLFIPNALTLAVIAIVNEILAATRGRRRDLRFASAARPPRLRFAMTPVEGLSTPANARLVAAVKAQLDYCAALCAAATSTSRHYSALAAGKRGPAAARLKDVTRFVAQSRRLQDKASTALARAGQAVAAGGTVLVVEPKQFRAFQEHLLRNGAFPADVDRTLRALLNKVDPVLIRLFDPYEVARRFALGMRVHEPFDLASVLLAEATAIRHLHRLIGPFPGERPPVPGRPAPRKKRK